MWFESSDKLKGYKTGDRHKYTDKQFESSDILKGYKIWSIKLVV